MAFVITEPCVGCKDQSCVPVCPCDCIHAGIMEQDGQKYDQLFIDPNHCIDCGLCEVECPVDAIFEEDEVPSEWSRYTQVNSIFFRQPKPCGKQDITPTTEN